MKYPEKKQIPYIDSNTITANQINITNTGTFKTIKVNSLISGQLISGKVADFNEVYIQNKPAIYNPYGSFGPLVLNRARNFNFSNSLYVTGIGTGLPLDATPSELSGYGFYAINVGGFPIDGNTAEGRYPSGIRVFNPYLNFNTGEYFINAYVYATNVANDGIHCIVRQIRETGINLYEETSVPGLIDFGGGAFGNTRIYTATSSGITPINEYISYKLYYASYTPTFPGPGNDNSADIQDVVLFFYRKT